MSPERKRASIVSVLLFLGLGHVRWAELKERREKANIPLIELLPVASMDCEKNLLEASMNKSTKRNHWNTAVHCWVKREWWPMAVSNRSLWVQII